MTWREEWIRRKRRARGALNQFHILHGGKWPNEKQDTITETEKQGDLSLSKPGEEENKEEVSGTNVSDTKK